MWTAIFCLSLLCPPANAADFAKSYGAPNMSTTFSAITLDASNNAYLAGNIYPAAALGSGVITKVDASGAIEWSRDLGGQQSNLYVGAIAVDSAENIYVAGTFSNSPYAQIPLIGFTDSFVIKLNKSGATVWAKGFGGPNASISLNSLAIDVAGNVYAVGQFRDGDLVTPPLKRLGRNDGYLIKLDNTGKIAWARNFGGQAADVSVNRVVTDKSGNVYVGGEFNSADLTVPPLLLSDNYDGFAFKLDSLGNFAWTKRFGGIGGSLTIASISVDASENVYLAGRLYGGAPSVPPITPAGFPGSAHAIKLDSSGTPIWAKSFGGQFASTGSQSIALGSAGESYVLVTLAEADLTTPTVARIGDRDSVVLHLDSNGEPIATRSIGGRHSYVITNGLAVGTDGSVYVIGSFAPTDLTSPPLRLIGSSDAFLIKQEITGASVVEFYNKSLDHYFITHVSDEIAKLDNGTFVGWARTGLNFSALSASQPGTSPVCRIYIPPGKGDGHYFGRDTAECDGTMANNPSFVLESATFFYLYPPILGTCPSGTTPVYRMYSNRPDANHRYTTDRSVRDQMVAKGWIAEGDGADVVVMCAP